MASAGIAKASSSLLRCIYLGLNLYNKQRQRCLCKCEPVPSVGLKDGHMQHPMNQTPHVILHEIRDGGSLTGTGETAGKWSWSFMTGGTADAHNTLAVG